MVNLNVDFHIGRRQSKFVGVTMWKHCASACEILDVSEFTTLMPLSLLIVGSKILPHLLKKFVIIFRKFIEDTFQFLVQAVLHIFNFFLCRGTNFQTMTSHLRPLNIVYILPLTNSAPLTVFPFWHLLVRCHFGATWPLLLPLNLTYTLIALS
jgi:hypothetical protein